MRADGRAQVSLNYPDSLTSWRATARAVSQSAQFGIATGGAKTRMPLLVRLQGPRFYLVGDTTVVSAVINNNTSHDIAASAELDAKGLVVAGAKGKRSVNVPALGEARVDWNVHVEQAGEAKLKVTVRGGDVSDAMEKSFPIFGRRTPFILNQKQEGTQTTTSATVEWRFGNFVIQLGARQVNGTSQTPGDTEAKTPQPSGEIRYTWNTK